MARTTVTAGVPTEGRNGGLDLSQASAEDVAREEAQMRRRAGRDDGDDERIGDREGEFDETRGMSNEEWDRARQPTDPERRRQIRKAMSQSLLPDLPQGNGWRRCWVSTSHPNDTPERRQAYGYRFCKRSELVTLGVALTGRATSEGREGTLDNETVRVREMVAMEAPVSVYIEYMREYHHDMPYDLARDIYDMLDAAGEHARDRGGRTQMEPGMEAMIQHVRPPTQFQ